MKKKIDYYGDEANYIHLKFGDVRKNYNFTSDFIGKYPLFAREYATYFAGNRDEKSNSQFRTPFQVVRYVYENKIPVHFYYNFTDTPAKNEEEIMAYLVRENAYLIELK